MIKELTAPPFQGTNDGSLLDWSTYYKYITNQLPLTDEYNKVTIWLGYCTTPHAFQQKSTLKLYKVYNQILQNEKFSSRIVEYEPHK